MAIISINKEVIDSMEKTAVDNFKALFNDLRSVIDMKENGTATMERLEQIAIDSEKRTEAIKRAIAFLAITFGSSLTLQDGHEDVD